MTDFEVLMPLTGGILIGIAASMMLLFSGRIAGVSGIFAGMLFQQGKERAWRLSFITGLIAGGILLYTINTEFFENSSGRGLLAVAIAGLLVGLAVYFGGKASHGALELNPSIVGGWEAATLVFGLIVTVQGFETSRYLGETYSPTIRVRSMLLAQLIATLMRMFGKGPPQDEDTATIARARTQMEAIDRDEREPSDKQRSSKRAVASSSSIPAPSRTTRSSAAVHLCGSQIPGASRRRRAVVSVTAFAKLTRRLVSTRPPTAPC